MSILFKSDRLGGKTVLLMFMAGLPRSSDAVMPASNLARSSLVSITQLLQQRRRDQKTQQFKERMHQRSAIEGTISELARAHGSRRSRYRGFAKVELQNLFIVTACNVKRWLQVPLEAKTPSNTQPLPFSDLLYNPVPFFEIVQLDLNPFSFFTQQAVM